MTSRPKNLWRKAPQCDGFRKTVAEYASGEGHGVGWFWAKCGMLAHAASAAVIFRRQFQGISSWMRFAG